MATPGKEVHAKSGLRPTCDHNAGASRCRVVGQCILAVAMVLGSTSCSRAPGGPGANESAAGSEKYREFNVTVYGYNYTDTEIGYFSAAFGPGGNVEVSTPTAGGGKSACCGSVATPLNAYSVVPVMWTRDGDIYCRQDVPLRGPVPANPEYLEVHFYRDGHVEVSLTEVPSPPRLRLERHHSNARHADAALNVNNDAAFSRCRHGDAW